MKNLALLFLLFALVKTVAAQEYLGRLSANPYHRDSTANRFGAGNPHQTNSINNPYGPYGSKYSNRSVNNPYATNAPKLYDDEGNYRGRLSANKYDPESISNPYGRYGSRYSQDSINNPFGAGSRFKSDSPSNPYGKGLKIYGDDGKAGFGQMNWDLFGKKR